MWHRLSSAQMWAICALKARRADACRAASGPTWLIPAASGWWARAAEPHPCPARSVAIRALAGRAGGDKYGCLTAIAWPSVRPAPLSSGQDKYFARAQHAVGLSGRFELEFQLPLNHEDQIDPVRAEPVLVDGLGPLAHPDHFDALPGEHGPDIAERRRTDLTGLAEHDVENLRGRAARILDRHEILSVGGDAAGPPRRATRSAPLPRGTSALQAGPRDRSQGSRRELVTLVPAARDQRPQNRLATALT